MAMTGTTGTTGTTGGRTSDCNTLQWQKSRKAGMCYAWRVVERRDLQTEGYLMSRSTTSKHLMVCSKGSAGAVNAHLNLAPQASEPTTRTLLWRSLPMAMVRSLATRASERVQVRRQTVSAVARSLATCDETGPLTGSVSGPAASGEWQASYQGFPEDNHVKKAKRV
jgi:hypothetical protein